MRITSKTADCRQCYSGIIILMKLVVRPIGNFLGVIIPKAALDEWGVGKGDSLELAGRCIRPVQSSGGAQEAPLEGERSLGVCL